MTVRWISERLGTSPWQEQLVSDSFSIVDVRLLRDAAGNSPMLIRGKIAEALKYLKRGDLVVICCDHGISRSNAIAAAVLAEDLGITLGESLRRVINATGEKGIKIDLVEDLRKALDTQQQPASSARALVLGLEGFIGRSIKRICDPSWSCAKTGQDQDLIDNPVLLDSAMDEAAADRILFCWHPRELDTNRAAGQLIVFLRNVLEVCRVRKAGLIFLSGHQVFAGHEGAGQVSLSEGAPLQPEGAAGDGLFLCETLIKQYEKRHGLPMLVVRSSHVYGPGDERPGILNTMVRKALSQQEIVTHHYQNGAPFIDLVHINDLARALWLAIEKQLTGVLHVASGNPIATDELARLIVRKASSSSNVASIEMPGNYRMARLESTIARIVLEWQPTINLEIGLSELIARVRQSPTKEKT
jgi:nucleoside-diphosphate-sugar epimerase